MRKLGAAKDVNPNNVLIVGAIVGSYFFIIKPLLEGLGLKKTGEEKAKEEAEKKAIDNAEDVNQKYSPWNNKLYKDCLSGLVGGGKYLYYKKADSIKQMAKNIYDSIGRHWYISDKPEVIEANIKQCTSKLQVSQLVNQYFISYKLDLYADIKNVLYTEETGTTISWDSAKQRDTFERILNYVQSLPLYTNK